MHTESSRSKPEKMRIALLWGALVPVLLLAILSCIVLLSPELHRLHGSAELSEAQKDALTELGMLAAKNRDVPIAAIILFGDSIIGRGRNTVVRDTNAAGHAEINAISDALARVGPERFRQLSRDSLVLVSTLEPCPMCRGAIIENRIRHVVFLKGRSLSHWLKQLGKQLQFELNKRKGADEALQDSLLKHHPDYDSARVEW